MRLVVQGTRLPLKGEVMVPGDKSISHRAVILGALGQGVTRVENFLPAEDCEATVRAFRHMGVEITSPRPGTLQIMGQGLYGLKEPPEILDFGNSGTTTRLLLGILSGQPFHTCVTGDDSLRRRPMRRVVEPLRQMGALVDGREMGNLLPLSVRGRRPLQGLKWSMPVASAQVKSALLLAGFFAEGEVEVTEPSPSRDHTERMMSGFGIAFRKEGNTVRIQPGQAYQGRDLHVPGDISTAAFPLAMAILLPGSRVELKDVGLNPTRTGILEVLNLMGAGIAMDSFPDGTGEPRGNLQTGYAPLRGVDVRGELIPRLIDEIPILSVMSLFAQGVTEIRDAAELRVKESDRIAVLEKELGKMGGHVTALPDGLRIEGGYLLRGTRVFSHGDHRVAMSLAVAGLLAQGETVIEDVACINTSYPGFFELLMHNFPETRMEA